MTSISTHVLDLARGVPASGLAVELYTATPLTPPTSPTPPAQTPPAQTPPAPPIPTPNAPSQLLSSATTDSDGRATGLADAAGAAPGLYRLLFATGPYRRSLGSESLIEEPFIEEASITFRVSGEARLHIPLLLSPFGLSIYRGS